MNGEKERKKNRCPAHIAVADSVDCLDLLLQCRFIQFSKNKIEDLIIQLRLPDARGHKPSRLRGTNRHSVEPSYACRIKTVVSAL